MAFSQEIWQHVGEERREVLPEPQRDKTDQLMAFSSNFRSSGGNHIGLAESKYYDFRRERDGAWEPWERWNSLRQGDSMADVAASAANTTEDSFLPVFFVVSGLRRRSISRPTIKNTSSPARQIKTVCR